MKVFRFVQAASELFEEAHLVGEPSVTSTWLSAFLSEPKHEGI